MASSFHRCAQIVFKNNHKVAASQRFGFYAILISSTVGNFIPPNQDKVKLARTFFSNFYLSFSPLFVNTSKFTDPSFIPLPLIFNSSIVFFSSLIGKSWCSALFCKNLFIVPALIGNLFFYFLRQTNLILSCLYKLEGTLHSNLVILYLIAYNSWLEK